MPVRTPLLVLVPFLLAASASAGAPKTGFVPVPGGKLFYEERGRGPAVVLIHGGMLDHRMWDPQVEPLSRRYRVIRYDVASHGQSPLPDGPWRNYEHLALLMDALKVDAASLVGLSLGGRVAVDFAIAHPGRVRSLVLVDPGLSGFPFTGRDWGKGLAESYRARQAGDAAKVADLFLRAWLAGPRREPSEVDPAIWAKAREMAVPNALRLREGLELEPPAVGRLGEVVAPTLVVVGELDGEDIQLIARHVERRVPGTRRVVVPGVAHMPNLERPSDVNRLLLDFLARPPAAPPRRPSIPSEEKKVEVDRGTLWAERAGEGEPVVLVHDGIVHAVGWEDVLPLLASQYELIRFDRRGYGRSSMPSAEYSPLADLEAVFASFGLRRAHVVGSSAGGGLAIDFALAHPGRVASLTLVGAVVGGFPYTRHFLSRGGRLTRKALEDPEEGRRFWTETDPYFVAPESKAARAKVAAILAASPGNLAFGKDRFVRHEAPALPRLGEIRVPALVVAGEHDVPDVHAHAGAIASGIPGARREVIAGAGHVPYLEQPAAFAAVVLEFLQGVPLDGRGAVPGSAPAPR